MKRSVLGITGGTLLSVSTAFLVLCFAMTVKSQCQRGDEDTCRWSNDEKSATKWVTETGSGESYIRLEKCQSSQCGTGTILSPWLPPNSSPNQLTLYFKVYGYSSVYLKLYQKKENDDMSKAKPLFTKSGNYGDSFPEKWSSTTVRIPPTGNNYQLMLKAYTPYSEGFVAVKGISVNGPNIIPGPTTTSSSTSTSTTTRRPGVTPSSTTTTTTTTEGSDIDFPDDERELEDGTNEMTQALEDSRFLSVEDFNLGHTTVVYPEICKY